MGIWHISIYWCQANTLVVLTGQKQLLENEISANICNIAYMYIYSISGTQACVCVILVFVRLDQIHTDVSNLPNTQNVFYKTHKKRFFCAFLLFFITFLLHF